MYFALIGDVVDSKNTKSRNELQKTLNSTIADLNRDFEQSCISKLTLTLGDEFQGLFSNVESILLIVDRMDTYFASCIEGGVTLRYGIGYGAILTEIDPEVSIGSDGPAYWNARSAINFVHKNNDSKNTNVALNLGFESKLLNSIGRIQDAIRNNWTKTQSEFMNRIITTFGYNEVSPASIGDHLTLTPQQVSNRLKSTYTRQYIDARIAFKELIEREIE